MPTTYVLVDTDSDLTSQGTVHNKKALAAGEGGTSLDITLGGGGSGSAAWYTEASIPNLTSWPAGDYTVSCDIDATGADITYTLSLRRVNASGVLQQTLGTSGTLSGTGLKSFTQNIASPITTNAGDRLVGVLSATRGASHGNQTLTISVNGANDQLIGAWSPAASPTRGRISWAEVEAPLAPTRGRISWTEAEAPFVATRGQISFIEIEVPLAPTRGRVSWSEVEVPSAPASPTRGQLSFAELEVPLAGTRGRVSFSELEVPIAPTRGRIAWSELEVPTAAASPTRGQVSFAELETPFQATRGRIAWAELESPLVPTRGRLSWAELETPIAPTRGRTSFAALEVPGTPTRGRISFAELQVPDLGGYQYRGGPGMLGNVGGFMGHR